MIGMILPWTPNVDPAAANRPAAGAADRDPASGAFGVLLAALVPPAQPAVPKPAVAPNFAAAEEEGEPGEVSLPEPAGEARGAVRRDGSGEELQRPVVWGPVGIGPASDRGTKEAAAVAKRSGSPSHALLSGMTEVRSEVQHAAIRRAAPLAVELQGAQHTGVPGALPPVTEPQALQHAGVQRAAPLSAEPEAVEHLPVPLRGDDSGVVRRGRSDAVLELAHGVTGSPGPTPARRAPRAVDAMRIESSLDVLVPEFRVRLERVISRMETEHGHRVDVVETLRHQVRQNQLFEQGRTQPGPVVTWTRSSNHTRGLAADVIIDGSYNNAAGYARLHRIAAEEGLRTLGARDPGHLELPRGKPAGARSQLAADGTTGSGFTFGETDDGPESSWREVENRPARPAERDGVARVARVAEPAVSRVAQVAAVAAPTVARVAAVAAPGKRTAESARPQEPSSAPAPDLPRVPGSAFAMTDTIRAAAPEGLTANPLRAGSAERIAHLLDMQSSAPLRPLSQVLLRVDGPGGEDRIRLDLRGITLGATLDINDPVAADRLNARIGDLQRALEQRGLETESLRVRATPRTDTVEISKLAAAIEAEGNRTAAVRSSADSSAPRDRPHDSPRDEPRQNPAHSRQRSRKDPNGGQNT